ncbi:Os12g0566250 [Oryza sativa Japonica Group]|uniref:Os12g0566250 protein n=2 Tax=Oryza sativa subsp. japonica TaxID=39947 RepID=C7J9V5_ORYSJ|nr:hypothetical protein EE612_060330 [Oryza sativa]BAH95740.1 Os12g0566250 [Oryza sativa Japonica Group]BAT17695.1 Os12g0566250 [Oryza sativa Japonica Group]|eukprot:NP_001177012.1 Os12g0566250 [Oryza sativa Japonica Group]
MTKLLLLFCIFMALALLVIVYMPLFSFNFFTVCMIFIVPTNVFSKVVVAAVLWSSTIHMPILSIIAMRISLGLRDGFRFPMRSRLWYCSTVLHIRS